MKARKHTMHFMALVAGLVAAAGCTYPFEIDVPESDGRIVIEGDIFIGEKTTVKISSLASLNVNDRPEPPVVETWVESEDGKVFPCTEREEAIGTYVIDTRSASDDTRYRLCVRNVDNGKEYVSSWEEVHQPSSIDNLSYSAEDYAINIELSMHASDDEKYFRWYYTEHWEYHAPMWTYYYYDIFTNRIREFENGANSYYCWNKRASSNILTFSTKDQTDNRFEDLKFHRVGRFEMKLQHIYCMEVQLEALSSDAYAYWENVKRNSEMQDNIFAPTPSEMAGNIRNIDDPREYVIGYINVARRATKRLFIYNSIDNLYMGKNPTFNLEELQATPGRSEWAEQYDIGLRPWYQDTESGQWIWLPNSCLDCTSSGGNKQKPDFWPSSEI